MKKQLDYLIEQSSLDKLISDLKSVWNQSMMFFVYHRDIIAILQNHEGNFFMLPASKTRTAKNTYFRFDRLEEDTRVTFVYLGFDHVSN